MARALTTKRSKWEILMQNTRVLPRQGRLGFLAVGSRVMPQGEAKEDGASTGRVFGTSLFLSLCLEGDDALAKVEKSG